MQEPRNASNHSALADELAPNSLDRILLATGVRRRWEAVVHNFVQGLTGQELDDLLSSASLERTRIDEDGALWIEAGSLASTTPLVSMRVSPEDWAWVPGLEPVGNPNPN